MELLPIITAFLTLTTLTGFGLYLKERYAKPKPPVNQALLDQAQTESSQIIEQAMKKSQDILSQSEVQGAQLIANTKAVISKTEYDYQQKLGQYLEQFKRALNDTYGQTGNSLTLSEKQFEQFLLQLQTKSDQFQTTSEQQIETRLNAWFEQLENRISEFIIQNEQKTVESIELEVKSTRQLIETYKTQQLSLIDENIIAMMEKTLSMVLNKKLTLKDQVDLVYEALEKAKVEKFIV